MPAEGYRRDAVIDYAGAATRDSAPDVPLEIDGRFLVLDVAAGSVLLEDVRTDAFVVNGCEDRCVHRYRIVPG